MTGKKKTARQRASRQSPYAPTSLYVRGFRAEVVLELKRRAGSRGLSHADYVSRLVDLHAMLLGIEKNAQMTEILTSLGLGRVES